jgi:2-amino-4-hydroxy-6-hydroxymethyldihydropteridine diphosphokinase
MGKDEQMTQVVLSLGSNLGDRAAALRFAVDQVAAVSEVLAVSGVYETPPWGDVDQPAYYNAVLLARAPISARQWLAAAQRIESEAGRQRDPQRRFGPRTLDVDIVMAWDDGGEVIVSQDPELTLPHPRAHLRAFVLRPWLEIQPYARMPDHGWVNDLVLAEPLAADVAAMKALPDVRLESDS